MQKGLVVWTQSTMCALTNNKHGEQWQVMFILFLNFNYLFSYCLNRFMSIKQYQNSAVTLVATTNISSMCAKTNTDGKAQHQVRWTYNLLFILNKTNRWQTCCLFTMNNIIEFRSGNRQFNINNNKFATSSKDINAPKHVRKRHTNSLFIVFQFWELKHQICTTQKQDSTPIQQQARWTYTLLFMFTKQNWWQTFCYFTIINIIECRSENR